jgi:hypothetical protein
MGGDCMREVIEYCLLAEFGARDINREVNKKLHEGWELYGSPTFTLVEDAIRWAEDGSRYESRCAYSQAMIRYKKEDAK